MSAPPISSNPCIMKIGISFFLGLFLEGAVEQVAQGGACIEPPLDHLKHSFTDRQIDPELLRKLDHRGRSLDAFGYGFPLRKDFARLCSAAKLHPAAHIAR